MKAFFLRKSLMVIFISGLILSQMGCEKDSSTPTTYPIQGLWEGTYTVGVGYPVPAGTSYYLSYGISPSGKLIVKAKGHYNGNNDYTTFADGTWTLSGTAFTFSFLTINAGGGTQFTQFGTATYNSSNGTLTNGTITNDNVHFETFTLTRVN